MVAAFVVRSAISRKFIFRVKFEVNLVRPVIPWDVPSIAPGYRFTHWFVSENVSITHRQPDRPNDAWQVFFFPGGKDAAPRCFCQSLHIMRTPPFSRICFLACRSRSRTPPLRNVSSSSNSAYKIPPSSSRSRTASSSSSNASSRVGVVFRVAGRADDRG